jgi:hypothetical protein
MAGFGENIRLHSQHNNSNKSELDPLSEEGTESEEDCVEEREEEREKRSEEEDKDQDNGAHLPDYESPIEDPKQDHSKDEELDGSPHEENAKSADRHQQAYELLAAFHDEIIIARNRRNHAAGEGRPEPSLADERS